jgi:uncharacterized protein YdaT
MVYILIYSDTYIERKEGESPNDRNDRAIRRACEWYQNHLKDMEIVFITDDVEQMQKAKAEGLHVYTMAQYADTFEDVPELAELVAAAYANDEHEDTFNKYETYEEVIKKYLVFLTNTIFILHLRFTVLATFSDSKWIKDGNSSSRLFEYKLLQSI